MTAPFELTKWYLDGVFPDGSVVIAYWAELRWHRLSGHYVSVRRCHEGRVDDAFSLRGLVPPVLTTSGVTWGCPPLELEGTWAGALAPEAEHTLLQRPSGTVTWRCHVPRAEVRLLLGRERLLGTGYAESLTLTVPPWALPIDTLRWGRGHAGAHSVVWVAWGGAEPCQVVLVDGRARPGGVVTADEVRAAGVTLRLTQARPLWAGPVGKTSVAQVPGLSGVLSSVGLLLEEHRWRAQCALELDGERSSGTALHEEVLWR